MTGDEIAEWLVARAAALGFTDITIANVCVYGSPDVISLAFTTGREHAGRLAMRFLDVFSSRNSYEFVVRAGRVTLTFDGPAPWAAA